ncbi:hypothetical protein RND81_13G106600 [Saponaria officinalis]|uniref:Uncharacterized protein n=1 Tax=Saponaria officinalis TaxID=3572 RepID=A0AAW1H0X8_SAPOF
MAAPNTYVNSNTNKQINNPENNNNNNNNNNKINRRREEESYSNSEGSSTNPHKVEEEEKREMENRISEEVDKNSHIVSHGFQGFTAEEILKYQKYEVDYACRLRAKYFSNKDIYGADIFDLTVAVDNETIKAGRWSPTRSYADPAQSFEDPVRVVASSSETPSGAKMSPDVGNGNMAPQRTI